jgi:hypothetical protein
MNPIVQDERRVREIVDEALRRRQRGEALSDATILAAHPEFSEPLAAALKRLRVIAAARAAAARSAQDEPPPAAALLSIRCPGCASLVAASADTAWDEIHCPTCGNSFRYPEASPPAEARPRTIAHFELVRPLGSGSFGEVWEARDTKLDRQVAIKLARHAHASPRETELFLREARTAANLRHPHIVAVFEIGQQGGQCYIASELVSGENVAQWLAAAEARFQGNRHAGKRDCPGPRSRASGGDRASRPQAGERAGRRRGRAAPVGLRPGTAAVGRGRHDA